MSNELDLTKRETFRQWTYDKLRYCDTDRQGHVNNAVFATFCETGRVAFLYNPEDPFAPPGTEFVIVRLTLDFRAELRYPGRVDIGTRLLSIGRSSFRVAHGIFKDDTCHATAEAVMVLFDGKTRRAVPIPESLRARLEAL
ncbi:MAG: acyl-CoA thioesterase [Rhodospirillales bacterium]|nr:acyl-CoA thioesterase [Rhodospirillales bacterium]